MTADTPTSDDHSAAGGTELSALHDELAGLSDLFRRRLLAGRETRQAVDALQTQLDRQHELGTGQVMRPLLYDIALVVDRIDREDRTGRGAGGPGVDPLAASVRLELLGLLEKYGVAPMPHGARFDATCHEAVGNVPTSDPALVGSVCQVTRDGYLQDGRVVRPQQVTVYTANPHPAAPRDRPGPPG